MKKARKASYWRWRGVAGSAKKRRQPVRSNGTLIDITYNVKNQIRCQSSFAVQTLTTTRNRHMTTVFMPNRIFVDNVCCLITNNETSRNCSISAPVRLTSRAKLLSQMNPIAGSMSADSRSVEIQASAGATVAIRRLGGGRDIAAASGGTTLPSPAYCAVRFEPLRCPHAHSERDRRDNG